MKKLMIFLMIAIPIVIIVMVNLTVTVVSGLVPVSVERIALNQSEIKTKINEKIKLEVVFYPENATNKNIEWVSDNEDVAIVDENGNVSFVGLGSGYITATSLDGNKKASCYFYSYDDIVHKILIDVKSDAGDFVVENEYVDLSVAVLPNEALNKEVYFESENEEIAKVDSNGRIFGNKAGKTKITVYSKENEQIYTSKIIEVVEKVEDIILPVGKVFSSLKSYKIEYDFYPYDTKSSQIEFVSKDENIATVDADGIVTFKTRGVVEIEVISKLFNIKKTMEIEYTQGFATELILEKTVIDAKLGDAGEYLEYSTLPENLEFSPTFESADENIVFVDASGFIQFLNGGSTSVTVSVAKGENEVIERVVYVNVENPATSIVIDDKIETSVKEVVLNPYSFPEESTNKKFFFKSLNEEVATVSSDGKVVFLKDEECIVSIEICANFENSNVKKQVQVFFTNSLPLKMEVRKDVTLNYGDTYKISPTFSPAGVYDVQFEIASQSQNSVISLDSKGNIRAIGGGEAIVNVSCESVNGLIQKEIKIYFIFF